MTDAELWDEQIRSLAAWKRYDQRINAAKKHQAAKSRKKARAARLAHEQQERMFFPWREASLREHLPVKAAKAVMDLDLLDGKS